MSLESLYDLDRSFPDKLDNLLHDTGYVDELRKLPDRELLQLVDHLNETLVRLDRTGGSSRKCLQVLRKICSSRKVLPETYELSRDLLLRSEKPIAHGGFCDAYEGTISVKVCIKRLTIPANCDQEQVKELLCKEAVVWKHLNHANIVPFRGVTFDPPQLVSEWMSGGELRDYVKNNPNINPFGLEGAFCHQGDALPLPQSLGIAEGLTYLHSKAVIHGDLKGANIMVDESGNARITDFGLATIVRGSNSVPSTSAGLGQSLRWTAPEVLKSDKVVTTESDVYSFAMVIIEVFTGEVPFKESKGTELVLPVIQGKRPGRPSHPKFTANLWDLTQKCWTGAPEDRPLMDDVLKQLTTISGQPDTGGTQYMTSEDEEEIHPSGYLMNDSDHGSELLPPLPSGDGGDGHSVPKPMHTSASETKKGPSLGRLSDSGAENGIGKGSGRRGDDCAERLGTDRIFAAIAPPPMLPATSAPVQIIKEHGLWCRTRRFLFAALKWF